jgi:hypothetical protein
MQRPHARIPAALFASQVLGLSPYDWQKDVMAAVEAGYPTALAAANGSGKTSLVFTALALWCLDQFPKARVVVTSGSWTQLQKQFLTWLRYHQANPRFRSWTFNETGVKRPEGGEVILISVNESGRAEGWHANPNSPVMLLVDEAKSVDDSVFEAFARVTTSFRCYASSPGPTAGAFYAAFTTQAPLWWRLKVPSAMCPHIEPATIERDRLLYGENSALFRSKHLAEFTGLDGDSFIPLEIVRGALENPPEFQEGNRAAFIDWSTGGDETVIAYRRGNRFEFLATFREPDPLQVCRRVANVLISHGITSGVMGDDGGQGRVFNADLRALGVSVRPIDNGAKAQDVDGYSNLAAEAWYNFRRLLERKLIILPEDPELLRQLTSRKIQYDAQARIQLEPKERMRARGLNSPDRADAIIGASIGLPPAAHWDPAWQAARKAELASIARRMQTPFPRTTIHFGHGYVPFR